MVACPSVAALAQHFSRSRTAIQKWLRRKDWPADVPRSAPWSAEHVSTLEAWASDLRPSRNPAGKAKSGPESDADRQLKLERCRLVKLQREILARKHHRTDRCERRMVAAIRAVRAGMATVAEALPRDLDGTPRQAWPRAIERRFDELCERFALDVGGDEDPAEPQP